MLNKKKRYIHTIILTVLCVLLSGAVIGEGALYYMSRQDYQNLKERYDAETKELKSSISSYETQLQEKSSQLEEVQTQLAQAQTQLESSQGTQVTQDANAEVNAESADGVSAEEGTLSPSGGSSVFSDTVLTPGEIIDTETAVQNMDQYFQAAAIERDGSVFARINGKSYVDNNDIALEDLRYLTMIHYNFDHQVQVGEMIVNAAIQDDVLNVFKELFQQGYEIQSMYLIDNYWVDGGDGDDADYNSIDHNNTSCFCYRQITGGGRISNHGYGRAIDINPQQNPYVTGGTGCAHNNAQEYAYNRESSGNPHVIVASESDICYSTFTKYGFTWGGNWTDPKDYQHFDKA